jgi:nicotinamidase/pyrazinamidase
MSAQTPSTSFTRSTHLLIIDAQNDFCDLPPAYCPVNPLTGAARQPALPVAGAHADMQRLAQFIRAALPQIDAITLTLDSHHRLDIAHPTFWQAGDGHEVPPFTPITAAQVRAGVYVPRQAQALPRALAYLDALEANHRYTLMVWPVHCEMGTWGHNLQADVQAACNTWEDAHGAQTHKLNKGSNPWTEHYSAVMAEVPDAQDTATGINHALLARLATAGTLLIAGEASSHCVRASTEHLLDQLPHAPNYNPAQRIVLLADCMSPVAGFEAMQAEFFSAAQSRGVQVATSGEMLAALL